MSVRRRSWTNRDGSLSEAWLVDYVDQRGAATSRPSIAGTDADAYHAAVAIAVRPERTPPTARASRSQKAGRAMAGKLRSSRAGTDDARGYRQHVDLHIVPISAR